MDRLNNCYSRSEAISAFLCNFSAFTLLIGLEEEHLACRNLIVEVLVRLSVWSKVQMICIWSS